MRLIEVAAIAVTSLMLLSPQPTLAAPPAQPSQPGQAGPAVTSAAAIAASPAPTPGTPATAAPAEQGPSEPTAAAKPAEPPKPPAPSLFAKVNRFLLAPFVEPSSDCIPRVALQTSLSGLNRWLSRAGSVLFLKRRPKSSFASFGLLAIKD